LQGRLPIRVELKALSREDFRRILTEPEHSLLKQASALMATEGVELAFDDGSVEALADLAAEINATVENIGARRLSTVLERLLEEASFSASDRRGETIQVDAAMVRDRVARWPRVPTCRATSCSSLRNRFATSRGPGQSVGSGRVAPPPEAKPREDAQGAMGQTGWPNLGDRCWL
jgi:hypothetical protein